MSATDPSALGQPSRGVALRRPSRRLGERAILAALLGCGLISILTTLAIVVSLFEGALEFFLEVSPIDYLTGTTWTPLFEDGQFGVLPLILNTLEVVAIAALVGLPLGLLVAIYLADYASPRMARIVKPVLELIAGIPTVVLGYFALTFVTPTLLEPLFADVAVFNALSAALVIGIMIVPLVASISEDAMRAVPNGLREAAYGMGATRRVAATRVVVPAALSGIVASFVLAVSRVVGETMVLALAAGSRPVWALDPLQSIQTMAAFIAQVATGDAPAGSIEYKTIFAVGLTLFVLTFGLNMVAQRIVARYRQVY